MNPTLTPNNDCGATDTNCDTTALTRGLENLDIGHIDAESVETRAVTERALEQLTHDMRPTLMHVREKMREERTGGYYHKTEEFMLKAAIIPRGGSEWRPSPKDELEFGVSARGQHQEFLVGLKADEEQQHRLPGFVLFANFRFRLHHQFEQILETDFGGPDIWFHVLRITRLYLDPDDFSAPIEAAMERFTTPSHGQRKEVRFVMQTDRRWDARFNFAMHSGSAGVLLPLIRNVTEAIAAGNEGEIGAARSKLWNETRKHPNRVGDKHWRRRGRGRKPGASSQRYPGAPAAEEVKAQEVPGSEQPSDKPAGLSKLALHLLDTLSVGPIEAHPTPEVIGEKATSVHGRISSDIKQELLEIGNEIYQTGAEKFEAVEGGGPMKTGDRLKDIGERLVYIASKLGAE